MKKISQGALKRDARWQKYQQILLTRGIIFILDFDHTFVYLKIYDVGQKLQFLYNLGTLVDDQSGWTTNAKAKNPKEELKEEADFISAGIYLISI